MASLTTPEQIFIDLVDSYLDRVFRYLCNLTRNEDLAWDLCQETFLRLRKRVDLEALPGEAYVFASARNTALSHWRDEKREMGKRELWGREATCQVGEPSSVEDGELRHAIELALGELSEKHRSVFLLSEVEGLKNEQVAEALGISLGTVASRKFYANQILRRELKRRGHEL